MRTMILLMMLSLSFTACNAQEKKEKEELKTKAEHNERPKGNWKVNREFDENGNLISYDSTYVYSWSSVDGDSLSDTDEIFKNFRQYFYRQNGNTDLMNSFLKDSIYGGIEFFEDEFFSNRMMPRHFQQQIRYMDSIRNEFLKKHYPKMYQESRPKLIPREEKKSDGMI